MLVDVKRQNGVVWIDGVGRFGPGDYASSEHGAQATILQTLGELMTYDDLVCYSAFAFRVGVHDEFCPRAGHPSCGYRCIEGSDRAIPWRVKLFESGPPMEAKADRTAFEAEVFASIKASVDRGIPVHYGSTEDGLIIGYSDEGRRWLCLHPYHRDGRDAFWYDQGKGHAGGHDSWPWGIVIWQEPKPPEERACDRELTESALQQAVDMWKSDKKHEGHYLTGSNAYDFWISRLCHAEEESPEGFRKILQGNGWCFSVLTQGRRIAGRWLNSKAEGFEGQTAEQLHVAANHYTALAEECMEGLNSPWELAPPPEQLEQWTLQMRSEQIKRLETARDHDRAAIGVLAKALAACKKE